MSKVRTNDGYKDIEAVYAGNIPIDTIYDKNGNILFSAYNEVNGISPLSFKSKTNNSSTLKNYRIYGKTSKNLFDYNSWKNVITGVTNSGTITFNSDNSFTLTSGETADVYTLPTTASNAFRCPVKGNTTYTFSFSSNNSTNGLIYLFENGINDSDHKRIAYNNTTKSVTFTTQSATTYVNVRFGVYPANSSITYKEVQLVEGEQIIEYEPYGESVGDKTNNLFDEATAQNVTESAGISKWVHIQVGEGTFTLSTNMPNVATSGFAANIFLLAGNVSTGANSATNGVTDSTPITVSSSDGYVTVGLRNANDYNPKDYNIMLNVGSEALPYEPYGYKVPVKVEGKNKWSSQVEQGAVATSGIYGDSSTRLRSKNIPVISGQKYTVSSNLVFRLVYAYYNDTAIEKIYDASSNKNSITITIPNTANNISICLRNSDNTDITPNDFQWGQIEEGEVATAYEPYHVPTTTNIYLPEQIKKVGDEAEYIDFKEQKQYRVRKNYIDLNNIIYQGMPTRPYLNNGVLVFPASQTSTQVARMAIPELNKDTTFTVSFDAVISENTTATFYFDGYPDSVNKNTSLGTDKLITVSNTSTHYSYSGVLGAGTDSIRFYRISTNTNYDTSILSISNIQLELGNVETAYEPYITDIELDVTLPSISIPSGINTLSVETEVQPSDIYLKGKIEKKPKIYYYSQDGQTLLYTESVLKGSNGIYSGTPTKMADPQYTYTFAGWSSSTGQTTATSGVRDNIQSDKSVYAAFSQTLNTYTVYFYNGETLLQTTPNVTYGGSATYSGTTPTKTGTSTKEYIFTGWSPEPTNISEDTSCYAQFEAAIQGLITDSWETIAQRAAAGTAQNYYSVGDCKAVTLNGTCGTLEINNVTLYVYILGFDHNSTYEGNGITFGGFKTSPTPDGKDICLIDSHYVSNDTTGLKWFNMSHRQGSLRYGHNYGGWKGCDMRYDILGSTDTAPSGYGAQATTSNVGYDASSTCATSPVANTLMSCLPSDLRAVMKPMTKYTDNVGDSSNTSENVTASIDYLPLLAEYEIFGARSYANQYEQNKQAQYAYYADGNNSKVKYRHSSTGSTASWWERSPFYTDNFSFCYVYINGGAYSNHARDSCGVAPIFLVSLQTYTVSYYSQDGLTLLGTETVDNGHNAQGLAQNPTKASDTDCDYTFVGWNSQGNKTTAEANILNSITQNKTVYAAFEQVYKSDTISDSWEDIIESCSNGTYSSKYSVGDLKTIDLGSEGIIQMEIVGIDADDKSDNSGKAPITWISKQLLNTSRSMNPAYSSGTEGTGTLGGWEKTKMRSYLKETIKPLIPETVRNAIKPVKKYTMICNVSGGPLVGNVLTTDDVWIPSHQEISGSSGSESSGVYYSASFPDTTSRIKSKVGGSAAWWWFRSAYSRYYFRNVDTDGSNSYHYSNHTGGVALGFCT